MNVNILLQMLKKGPLISIKNWNRAWKRGMCQNDINTIKEQTKFQGQQWSLTQRANSAAEGRLQLAPKQ